MTRTKIHLTCVWDCWDKRHGAPKHNLMLEEFIKLPHSNQHAYLPSLILHWSMVCLHSQHGEY
jgi:hypothetical protein